VASKTVTVRVFIRSVSWTSKFRLRIAQRWVADNYSTDMTATTTRQEFTFTQTFTSSNWATGIDWWISADTTFSAADFYAVRCKQYVIAETLRDDSPNLGNFVGRKTNTVLSAKIKLTADASWSSTDTHCVMLAPFCYIHIRTSNNTVQCRFDTRQQARIAWTDLWTGFRWEVTLTANKRRNWSSRAIDYYLNWALTNSSSGIIDPPWTIYSTFLWVWRRWTTYLPWYVRDIRVYTAPSWFTAPQAVEIHKWADPAGLTRILNRKPKAWESWLKTIDYFGNLNIWTLNNWVLRARVP
jgi:hypothetical protein